MAGGYFGGLKLGKQLAEKAKELAHEREEAERALQQLEDTLRIMDSMGISRATVSDIVARAHSDFEAKQFKSSTANALKGIELSGKLMSDILGQRLESTTKLLDLRSSYDLDNSRFSEMVQRISGMISSGQYLEAEGSITQLWQELERSLHELFSQRYSVFQEKLNLSRTNGLDCTEMERLLSEAKNRAERGDLEGAFVMLSSADKDFRSMVSARIDDLTSQLAENMELARKLGLGANVNDMLSPPATSNADPFQLITQLSSANRDLERKLRRVFEMRMKTAQVELRHESFSPAFVNSMLEKLRQVRESLDRLSFEEGYSRLGEVERDIEEEKKKNIALILIAGKKYLLEATRGGADTSQVHARMNEVKELMKRKRYSEAIKKAHEANELAMRAVKPIMDARELSSQIEESYAKASSFVNSAELNIRHAEVMKHYGSRKFDEFIREGQAFLNEIKVSLDDHVKRQTDTLERMMGALEFLGADVIEIAGRIDEASSLARKGDFSQSIKLLQEVEGQTEALLKSAEEQWKARALEAAQASGEQLRERLNKMNESVAELEKKGELYRAACVAKDVVEWSTGGDAYRATSMLHRARRLLSIAEGPGANAASMIIEQAEKLLQEDVEKAMVLAGQAHDMLFTLITDRISQSINELMATVSSCRKRKIEVSYALTLISRARSALQFEDFETAIRMLSIARADIERRVKEIDALDQEYFRVKSMLQEMTQKGMDVNEISASLSSASEALSKFDYASYAAHVNKAREIGERALAAITAPKEVVKMKALMQSCVQLGIAEERTKADREAVSALMRERKYYEALQLATQISTRLREEASGLLHDRVERLKEECSRLQRDGVQTGNAELSITRASELAGKQDYEGALRAISLASQELEKAGKARDEAMAAVGEASAAIDKLHELDMIDKRHIMLLREARSLLNQGNHLLAMQTASRCMDACRETVRNAGMKKLRELVSELMKSTDVQIDDVSIDRIRTLIEAGDLSAADALLALRNEMHNRSLQREASARTVEQLESGIGALFSSGVRSRKLEGVLESMRSSFSRGDHARVIELGMDAQQIIEEVKAKFESALASIARATEAVDEYEAAGMDVSELRASVQKLVDMKNVGEYESVISESSRLIQRAREIGQKAAERAIQEMERLASISSKLDLQVQNTDECKQMLSTGNIAEAYSCASAEIASLSSTLSTSLEERMSHVLDKDWITVQLAERYSSSLTSMVSAGKLEEAVEFISRAETELSSMEATARKLQEVSNAVSGILAHLKSAGIPVGAAEQRCRELSATVTEESIQKLQKLQDELQKVRQNFSPKVVVLARPSQWGPMIEIRNTGRVVALELEATITAGSSRELHKIGDLKPGESRSIGLGRSLGGEGMVTVSGKNPVSGNGIYVARQLSLLSGALSLQSRCEFCRGKIKADAKACICGREYHAACYSRAVNCACGDRLS